MLKKNQILVFKELIDLLNKNKINYQVSGGLAAICYGSERNLYDIDVEVDKKGFEKSRRVFKKYIHKKPYRLRDEKWDIYLMTIKIKDVLIDISRIEDAYIVSRDGVKIKLETNLKESKKIKAFGIVFKIEPRKDLVVYKTLLGRKTDITDVKSLSGEKIIE